MYVHVVRSIIYQLLNMLWIEGHFHIIILTMKATGTHSLKVLDGKDPTKSFKTEFRSTGPKFPETYTDGADKQADRRGRGSGIQKRGTT